MAEAPVQEFSDAVKGLGDKIVELTVKDAQSLADYLKETYNIEPAGGGVVAIAGAGGGGEEAAEEPTNFDVMLLDCGAKKINVIKLVRAATQLGLKVRGFIEDVTRLGRADDVAVVMFSEFGRRVEENASLGTDHGTAGPMFLVGRGVEGGFHGKTPSLTDLDDGNLKMTTDFRSVYATAIEEWMGYDDSASILKGDFEPLGVFT